MLTGIYTFRVRYKLLNQLNEMGGKGPVEAAQKIGSQFSNQFEMFVRVCRKNRASADDAAAVIAAWLAEVAIINGEKRLAELCLDIAKTTADEIVSTKDSRRGGVLSLLTELVEQATKARSQL